MKLRALLVAALALPLAACFGEPSGPSCNAPRVTIPALGADTVRTASGLKYQVRTQGTGATAQATSTVTINYTGYLTDGTMFDRATGVTFSLRQVIPGFAEGIAGMQAGGSRRIIIPPSLGYGANSPDACIPANSTLIFDVDLISVPAA